MPPHHHHRHHPCMLSACGPRLSNVLGGLDRVWGHSSGHFTQSCCILLGSERLLRLAPLHPLPANESLDNLFASGDETSALGTFNASRPISRKVPRCLDRFDMALRGGQRALCAVDPTWASFLCPVHSLSSLIKSPQWRREISEVCRTSPHTYTKTAAAVFTCHEPPDHEFHAWQAALRHVRPCCDFVRLAWRRCPPTSGAR